MRVAVAYEKLERPDDMQRVVTQALEFARSQAEPREQSDCLAEVGGALYSMKKPAEGKTALDEAQAAAAKIATDDSKAYALLHIAQKASAAGQKGAARKLLDEAKDVATKVTDGSVRTQLNEDIDSALNSL
jgi:hypothetical protein